MNLGENGKDKHSLLEELIGKECKRGRPPLKIIAMKGLRLDAYYVVNLLTE